MTTTKIVLSFPGALGIRVTPREGGDIVIKSVAEGCPRRGDVRVGDVLHALGSRPILAVTGDGDDESRILSLLAEIKRAPRPLLLTLTRKVEAPRRVPSRQTTSRRQPTPRFFPSEEEQGYVAPPPALVANLAAARRVLSSEALKAEEEAFEDWTAFFAEIVAEEAAAPSPLVVAEEEEEAAPIPSPLVDVRPPPQQEAPIPAPLVVEVPPPPPRHDGHAEEEEPMIPAPLVVSRSPSEAAMAEFFTAASLSDDEPQQVGTVVTPTEEETEALLFFKKSSLLVAAEDDGGHQCGSLDSEVGFFDGADEELMEALLFRAASLTTYEEEQQQSPAAAAAAAAAAARMVHATSSASSFEEEQAASSVAKKWHTWDGEREQAAAASSVAKKWHTWDGERPASAKLHFSNSQRMPGLVSKVSDDDDMISIIPTELERMHRHRRTCSEELAERPEDGLTRNSTHRRHTRRRRPRRHFNGRCALSETEADDEEEDDDDVERGAKIFEHVMLIGATPGAVVKAVQAEAREKDGGASKSYTTRLLTDVSVLSEFPAGSVSAELRETVCCFCAPCGLQIGAESFRSEAEAEEDPYYWEHNNNRDEQLDCVVNAFAGGSRKNSTLYAVTLTGLTRRDCHRRSSAADGCVVTRSEVRVVILTERISLLALHFAAARVGGGDVGRTLEAAFGDTAVNRAAAATEALRRFAESYSRCAVPPPGGLVLWTPPLPMFHTALTKEVPLEDLDAPTLLQRDFGDKHDDSEEDAKEEEDEPARATISVRRALSSELGDDEKKKPCSSNDSSLLEWALPTLLDRVRPAHLFRTLAAILAEMTVVVECSDEAALSACVLGLVVLLKPLHPAGPTVVLLPERFADYLDSPVPVLVGVLDRELAVSHLERLGQPAVLLGCDTDSLRLYGDATPQLTLLPEAARLHAALIPPLLQKSASTQSLSSPPRHASSQSISPRRASAPPSPSEGTIIEENNPQDPGDAPAPCEKEETRRVASIFSRHVALLTSAALDRGKKRPQDPADVMSAFAEAFVGSQLLSNFRGSIDSDKDSRSRLGAAVTADACGYARMKRALRHTNPPQPKKNNSSSNLSPRANSSSNTVGDPKKKIAISLSSPRSSATRRLGPSQAQ